MKRSKDADRAELSALNARFIHNYITRDVSSHSAITHERFININTAGKYTPRDEYLRYWATAFDPEVVIYWDLRDERIDVFGDVALVRATNKHIERRNGRETVGMTTYTDSYLRTEVSWVCIQAQLTSVTPENYPSDDTILRIYRKGELQSQ